MYISGRSQPYTLREVAEATGTSYQHVWRMCKQGKLPHSRLGSKILVPPHVVRCLVEGAEVAK